MTRESFVLPVHLGKRRLHDLCCEVGLKPSDRQHVLCEGEKDLTEHKRKEVADRSEIFISVDSNGSRALVTTGEFGQFQAVHEVVLPNNHRGVQRCSGT